MVLCFEFWYFVHTNFYFLKFGTGILKCYFVMLPTLSCTFLKFSFVKKVFSIITLYEVCYKNIQTTCFTKNWRISMKRACMRQPWAFIRIREFSRIFIASVDGKEHLNEGIFSALVGFSLLEKYPTFRRGTARSRREPYQESKDLANHRNLVFRQKCLKQVRGTAWRIVVMETPIACWLKLRFLAPHSIT